MVFLKGLIEILSAICIMQIVKTFRERSVLTVRLLRKLIRQEHYRGSFKIDPPQDNIFRVQMGPLQCTYMARDIGSTVVETVTVRAEGRTGELKVSIEGIKVVELEIPWPPDRGFTHSEWEEIETLLNAIRYEVSLYASRGYR